MSFRTDGISGCLYASDPRLFEENMPLSAHPVNGGHRDGTEQGSTCFAICLNVDSTSTASSHVEATEVAPWCARQCNNEEVRILLEKLACELLLAGARCSVPTIVEVEWLPARQPVCYAQQER